MTDQETGTGTAGPETLTITVGGITVEMAPCGWRDLVEIPEQFEALGAMPTATEADLDAMKAAFVAFADRLDAYAAGPVKPSRIPPGGMQEFVVRWVSGVRDAALPPASDATSPKPGSSLRQAAPPSSR